MADPAIDYEIELDIYDHIHVLRSPFFDVGFGFDDNVEDYLNRILPTLVDAIDEQFSDYEWIIQGQSPASPTPASSPATSPLGVTCVLVVSEDDAKVKRAFQTLLTYVGNVARNPNEEKFRKIRLNNATFSG